MKRRIAWFPASATRTAPAGSNAIPCGDESSADVADEPSPALPAVPVPATVTIVPPESIVLTAWLPVSVKKTVPSARIAIPLGASRRALVAAPRSPP